MTAIRVFSVSFLRYNFFNTVLSCYVVLSLLLPILPSFILSQFYNFDIFANICDRNLADLLYLKEHADVDFVSTYVGSYLIQFYATILFVLIVCALVILGKPIYFIDIERLYLKIFCYTVILLFVSIYNLFYTSDFAYNDGIHSWFEDKYSAHRKFMPLPTSKFALIYVSAGFMLLGLCLAFISTLVIVIMRGEHRLFGPGES